jgi:hypothetical protein
MFWFLLDQKVSCIASSDAQTQLPRRRAIAPDWWHWRRVLQRDVAMPCAPALEEGSVTATYSKRLACDVGVC